MAQEKKFLSQKKESQTDRLSRQYIERFKHEIPDWAYQKMEVKEKAKAALESGEPVAEWRDYKPNPLFKPGMGDVQVLAAKPDFPDLKPPQRSDYSSDETYDEARNYWQLRIGRSRAKTPKEHQPE